MVITTIAEAGVFYLLSRYYDPVTHKFINADGYFQSDGDILEANTFAYCGNNPVNNSDPNGEFVIAASTVTAIFQIAITMVFAVAIATTITHTLSKPSVHYLLIIQKTSIVYIPTVVSR